MIHYKHVVNRLSGTCVIFKKQNKKGFRFVSDAFIHHVFSFFIKRTDKRTKTNFLTGFHSCNMVFREMLHLPSPLRPPWQLGSQREQTGLKRAGESRVHVSDSSGQASDVTATVMAPWEAGDSGCWERALRYSGSESRLTNTNWLHCYVSFGW